MPILSITGSANEDDIVATLGTGANDYMFRPTRRREVITRVLVLLRGAYPSQAGSEKLEIGPYVFEPRRGRLTAMGKPVDVTKKSSILHFCSYVTLAGRYHGASLRRRFGEGTCREYRAQETPMYHGYVKSWA